jgi:hypothetical protein
MLRSSLLNLYLCLDRAGSWPHHITCEISTNGDGSIEIVPCLKALTTKPMVLVCQTFSRQTNGVLIGRIVY